MRSIMLEPEFEGTYQVAIMSRSNAKLVAEASRTAGCSKANEPVMRGESSMSIRLYAHALLFLLGATVLTASAPSILGSGASLEDSEIVKEMVTAQIAAGDRFMLGSQFGHAEGAYRVAAALERARGRLPVEAVRRMANARYFQGDLREAATHLADLADDAAAAGERQVEFWAAIDAAYISRLAGDDEGLRTHITRAQMLLDTGTFPQDEVDDVVATVTSRDLRVFAPHLATW